jgi:hypothetical protein
MSNPNLIAKLQKLKSIRVRQVYCPVAKLRALVSPLTVSDDLSLKTMVSSPDLYDRELAIMIYNHAEFPDIQGPKPSFDQFIDAVSDFDKKSLLWGIYDSTYTTLGTQQITCPKCKHKFENEIKAKELLSEDSIKSSWDKELGFLEYSIDVDIPLESEEITKFRFLINIPSIKKHLDVLKLISVDDMKDNFTKFNSIVSKTEELTLITKAIEVYGQDEETADDVIDNIFDIHNVIQSYVTLDVINIVIDKFDAEYSKFNPEFKKPLVCGACNHNFDVPIDIEVALFRSFLRL